MLVLVCSGKWILCWQFIFLTHLQQLQLHILVKLLSSFRLQKQGTERSKAFQFDKHTGAKWRSKLGLWWLLFLQGKTFRQNLNPDASVSEVAKIHILVLCPSTLRSGKLTVQALFEHIIGGIKNRTHNNHIQVNCCSCAWAQHRLEVLK